MVSRVQDEEPEPFENLFLDAINRVLRDLIVPFVRPPDEHVSGREDAVGKALIGFMLPGGGDVRGCPELLPQRRGDRRRDAVG